jgi:magnesium chelatase subunit H
MRADIIPIRVVIVTMDSYLARAAEVAQAVLRRDIPGLVLKVHAADEWGQDASALNDCLEDIERADIVVAAMLFLEDHIRAVMPALIARRDHCDAMLCAMSAGEVVKLTRLGGFNMSAKSGGAISMLKRLRGKSKPGQPASGRDQMKMLKRLPKLLRFIPGTAQDARSYFLALQYWIAGSETNLVNLVRLLVGRYASGERQDLAGTVKPEAPVEYPDVGLFHPSLKAGVTTSIDKLPKFGPRGTVGLLLLRSYVLAGNAAHYEGVIAALEAQGLRVLPAFSAGLDQRPAIEQYFLRDGAAIVANGFFARGWPRLQ